ncbi:MAG: hypothetical protein AAGA25_09580 [Planctomycetota bacterium]
MVIVACGYGAYRLSIDFLGNAARLNLWHLLYLLPLLIFGACAAYFVWGVKAPTHSHLSLVVSVGFFTAVAWLIVLGNRLMNWLFVPEAAGPIGEFFFWPALAFILIIAIAVDWRVGKSAGFVSADQVWWQEKHIRSFCIFLGWIVFFAGMGVIPMNPEEKHLFKLPEHSPIYSLMFLGHIAFCVFVAKGLPRLAMSVTGVEPAPRVPRRRRKGFHLWQSTEPVPPSASTEVKS